MESHNIGTISYGDTMPSRRAWFFLTTKTADEQY